MQSNGVLLCLRNETDYWVGLRVGHCLRVLRPDVLSEIRRVLIAMEHSFLGVLILAKNNGTLESSKVLMESD